jgi:NADPH-dependent 2,4-dienoyl-CoA reductase/sulfur reductase-like enzyme
VTRLVVIGGGAAGMSAASAARRTAPDLDVVVCEAGSFAAYGMCGIPYFLGGTVERAESLLAYPPEEFREKRGIDLRLRTRVTQIDPDARQVHLSDDSGSGPLGYDAFIVASGADPVRPYAGLTVADLAALDLSYAPPFAPVYDPVLVAAGKATRPVATSAGGSP